MSQARVIVAEDDQELLDVVAKAIESTGAEVVRVESGADLIQYLADEAFDLIVTDVSMPWMSGLQVALSARQARIQTPVIVMTGSRRADIAGAVAALGGRTKLLHKPFDLGQLLDAMKGVMS